MWCYLNGSNSGLAAGDQTSLEQNEYAQAVAANEEKVHEEFLRKILPSTSPLHIPQNASIKEEHKVGYEQVKYTWANGDYNYTSRWHTRTPEAPPEQGNSWVVERKRPGIGYGKNARPLIHEVMIKTDNGFKWVPFSEWKKAISARKTGTSSEAQKELLKNGHWPDN